MPASVFIIADCWLKHRFGVTQDYWKWHHSIDLVRVPFRLPRAWNKLPLELRATVYTDCSVKHQKYFVCCCFVSSPVFTAQRVCIAQTMPWQNVCPFVCPSVTRRYCVKTVTHILKRFQPSGSPTILVFPHQTRWQYSDGTHLTGRRMQGVWKYHDFRPISVFVAELLQDGVIVTMEGE